MRLNLLVIRSAIPDKLAAFYTHFGLTFKHHGHGNGPLHYGANVDGITLEIYPLKRSQTEPDLTLRLGFAVENLDDVVAGLPDVISEPAQSEWGYRAVVADPGCPSMVATGFTPLRRTALPFKKPPPHPASPPKKAQTQSHRKKCAKTVPFRAQNATTCVVIANNPSTCQKLVLSTKRKNHKPFTGIFGEATTSTSVFMTTRR